MKQYHITAKYMLAANGRSNDTGMAIAAKMNKNIDDNTDLRQVEREFETISADDANLWGLNIETTDITESIDD